MTGFFERISRRSAGHTGAPHGVTLSLRQHSRFEPAAFETQSGDARERAMQAEDPVRAPTYQFAENPPTDATTAAIAGPEDQLLASPRRSFFRDEQPAQTRYQVAPGVFNSDAGTADVSTHEGVQAASDYEEADRGVVPRDRREGMDSPFRDAPQTEPEFEHVGVDAELPEKSAVAEYFAPQDIARSMEVSSIGDNVDRGNSPEGLETAEAGRPLPTDHTDVPVSLDVAVSDPLSNHDQRQPADRNDDTSQYLPVQTHFEQARGFADDGAEPAGGLSVGQITVEFLPPPTPSQPSGPAQVNRTRGFDDYARARRGVLR